jgi:hypothetical protein
MLVLLVHAVRVSCGSLYMLNFSTPGSVATQNLLAPAMRNVIILVLVKIDNKHAWKVLMQQQQKRQAVVGRASSFDSLMGMMYRYAALRGRKSAPRNTSGFRRRSERAWRGAGYACRAGTLSYILDVVSRDVVKNYSRGIIVGRVRADC